MLSKTFTKLEITLQANITMIWSHDYGHISFYGMEFNNINWGIIRHLERTRGRKPEVMDEFVYRESHFKDIGNELVGGNKYKCRQIKYPFQLEQVEAYQIF